MNKPLVIRRHSSRFVIVIGVLVTSGSMADPATEFQGMMGNPGAAKNVNFCEWAYGEADRYGPLPDLQAIIDNDAGELSQQTVVSALLIKAGIEVAVTANGRKNCNREFRKGRKSFDKALRKSTRKFQGRAGFDASDVPGIATIQREITRLWAQDQAARIAYIDLQTDAVVGAAYWAQRLSVANAVLVDAEATHYMMSVLEDIGWIDSKRFGAAVSRHAWILVQHADKHPAFQAKALQRMENHVASGGVLARDYAYLWDRVAVNTGRLQRYGTQPTWECADGALTLHPMEDPVNVDSRRAAMGLESAASALAGMAQATCR